MALVYAVGSAKNETYITVEEMLEYLHKNYVSSDPLRIQWEALDQEDSEVYLRRAFNLVNSLPYKGKPASAEQRGAFPRAGKFTEEDLLKVKYAQAEQALALTDAVTAQETEERMRLRRAGVVQYNIGDLSEKFQEGLSAGSCGNFYGLSENAFRYLSKWLQGGYPICTSIKKPSGYLR